MKIKSITLGEYLTEIKISEYESGDNNSHVAEFLVATSNVISVSVVGPIGFIIFINQQASTDMFVSFVDGFSESSTQVTAYL